MKNARRNRRRTVFLVLLVAVPVAFGIVVTGFVRADSLTPEEQAQSNFGAADAQIRVASSDPEVAAWVRATIAELAPESETTEVRTTGIRVRDIGYSRVWDLDMSNPITEGLLVQVSGDPPQKEGEVAISPALADELDVAIGDKVEFEHLPLGELQITGMVSEQFFLESNDVLVAQGALGSFVGDPILGIEPSILVSGPDAENAVQQLADLWYLEGQSLFWPEPAVDPIPAEIEFLDPQTYLLLTADEIAELVDLVRTSNGTEDEVWNEVWSRSNQMIYASGYLRSLPDVYVETRTQWLSYGDFTNTPGATSTIASAILLIEVAFITGAAFAAGTRRRLREIGLMGANGASQAHVRSTVVGEGLTIGAIGAGLGVLLGVGVLVIGRPILQRLVSRVISGLGIGVLDLLGPVLVALVAVLLAVLIPARTASKVPTTTALQGRMPALSPRKWVVPAGVAMAAAGFLLISVSLVSVSGYAGFLVGVGAVAVVGGVAMLSSPILSSLSKLANRVPATGRLVLRDSGRNRTRSAVAVAAIMVILLAPVAAMTTAATTAEKELVFGLPEPGDQLVLSGSYTNVNIGEPNPIEEADVAELASIVPERSVAVFDTIGLPAVTKEAIEARESHNDQFGFGDFVEGNDVAIANDDLMMTLAHPGVTNSIRSGQVVVLGVEDKETVVEIDGTLYPASEYAVPVLRWRMPRVLIPEAMAEEFSDVDTRPIALFTLERPLTDDEWQKTWNSELEINGGHGAISESTVYLLVGAVTLIVVLIVIALVTAVSAAEVDHEVRAIVAIGAPGSIRRRFLALLTGYQTLVAMALAVPLGLGLVWVFSSSQHWGYAGPFGWVDASLVVVPWMWLIPFALLLPLVIGLLTLISVRSAPVTPPRRAT